MEATNAVRAPIRILRTRPDQSAYSLLVDIDHEGITSSLKSSQKQYEKKLLDSSAENWLSISGYFDRFSVRATIIKLNSTSYQILASPNYEKVGDQLLTRIAGHGISFSHKTRTVPTNPEARRLLEAWAMGRKNEFVFYNHETGKPFVDLDAGLALACRKVGIEGITWHKLRHTFASRLLNRGVDIVTVQQLLGHSTVVKTMRYSHTSLDSKPSVPTSLRQV
jgi:Phage integrase family